MHKGSCLCGAVSFRIEGGIKPPDACHCVQCRKTTGHFLASTDIPKSSLDIDGENHVKWFQSSPKVRRGFCDTCGSTLFWDPVHHDWIGVAMGAIDGPTNTKLSIHIFVGEKGDYYDITDGLPQNQT